jgi:hypothetical protein
MEEKMQKKIQTLLATGLVLFGLTAGPVLAQPAKDIEVLPSNNPRTLHININKQTVPIGDNVEFSFSADRDGYVSLWDIGTSGKVTRIYPNQYSPDGRVVANQPYGAGGMNDRFAFKVNGPTGMEDVYLVWTATPGEQPKQFSYPSARGLAKDLEVVARMQERDWATVKTTFEIVNGMVPVTTVSPSSMSVNVNTNVYVLAMGANVQGLTKTNLDARNFVNSMKTLFRIPDGNIRLIENAYARDFQDGMAWLQQTSGPNDMALIFFSGHGTTVKDDNGDEKDGVDEAFVMYDAEGAQYPRAGHVVRDDQFASWISALGTSKVFTFVDACHSGGLNKSFSASRTKFFVGGDLGITLPVNKSYSQKPKDLAGGMDPGTVKGLVYAASGEEQSALETVDGGLFITSFLEVLSRNSGNSGFNVIFEQAKLTVRDKSKKQQTPVAVGNTSLGGQW